MVELQNRIKYIRKTLNIGSQEKLAYILNVKGSRVKSIETGRVKDLTAMEANIMVKKFNLDIDWLLTGKGEMLLKDEKTLHVEPNLSSEEQELLDKFRQLPKELKEIHIDEIDRDLLNEAIKDKRKKQANNPLEKPTDTTIAMA